MIKYFRSCPICGNGLQLIGNFLYCAHCDEKFKYDEKFKVWRNRNIMDISYGDPDSGILSTLFPHKFNLETAYGVKTFNSMEAFFLTLCWPGSNIGIYNELASLYGMDTLKAKSVLPDWKTTQKITWNRSLIKRDSVEYQKLITNAFDELFKQSHLFRLGLMKSRGKVLMHTVGEYDYRKTLLTPKEYISLLERERSRITT